MYSILIFILAQIEYIKISYGQSSPEKAKGPKIRECHDAALLCPHVRGWFWVPQPILIWLALFSVPMATAICSHPHHYLRLGTFSLIFNLCCEKLKSVVWSPQERRLSLMSDVCPRLWPRRGGTANVLGLHLWLIRISISSLTTDSVIMVYVLYMCWAYHGERSKKSLNSWWLIDWSKQHLCIYSLYSISLWHLSIHLFFTRRLNKNKLQVLPELLFQSTPKLTRLWVAFMCILYLASHLALVSWTLWLLWCMVPMPYGASEQSLPSSSFYQSWVALNDQWRVAMCGDGFFFFPLQRGRKVFYWDWISCMEFPQEGLRWLFVRSCLCAFFNISLD